MQMSNADTACKWKVTWAKTQAQGSGSGSVVECLGSSLGRRRRADINLVILLFVMEHLGLSLSSHNNYIVLSVPCLCGALLMKFLVLQWPGSKPAWAGGRPVAPNCSPGAERIGMRHRGLNPAASCFLKGVCGCAHTYGSYPLNSVIYCVLQRGNIGRHEVWKHK